MIRFANGPNAESPIGKFCGERQVSQIGWVEIAAIGPGLVNPVMQRAAQAAKCSIPQELGSEADAVLPG